MNFLTLLLFQNTASWYKSEFLINILSFMIFVIGLMVLEVLICNFNIAFRDKFNIRCQIVQVPVITKLKSEWIDSVFLFERCNCLLTLPGHHKMQIVIVQSSACCIYSTVLTIAITFRSLISCCIYLTEFQRLYLWSFRACWSFTRHFLLLAYKPLKTLFDLNLIVPPLHTLFDLILSGKDALINWKM